MGSGAHNLLSVSRHPLPLNCRFHSPPLNYHFSHRRYPPPFTLHSLPLNHCLSPPPLYPQHLPRCSSPASLHPLLLFIHFPLIPLSRPLAHVATLNTLAAIPQHEVYHNDHWVCCWGSGLWRELIHVVLVPAKHRPAESYVMVCAGQNFPPHCNSSSYSWHPSHWCGW